MEGAMSEAMTVAEKKRIAELVIPLVDHTRLVATDNVEAVVMFAKAAMARGSASGVHRQPAAVCILPEFVAAVRNELPHARIATVVNFPRGTNSVDACVDEARRAIQDGAQELDAVINYQLLKSNRDEGLRAAAQLVGSLRKVCSPGILLKIIIESGELSSPDLIAAVTQVVVDAGADFVKTSTGKVAVNATPEAVAAILSALKLWYLSQAAANGPAPHRLVGLKVAGGVATIDDVQRYLRLIESIMQASGGCCGAPTGDAWMSPQLLRFGSSSLLNTLLQHVPV